MKRCPQHLYVCTARYTGKERAKLCVIVPDQESGRLPKWRGFSQLLSNPSIGGMAGHRDVDDFSALQLNHEESKERAEDEVSDRQEVAGLDLARMIVQEATPGLGRRTCA
jgi:hypothetical protein